LSGIVLQFVESFFPKSLTRVSALDLNHSAPQQSRAPARHWILVLAIFTAALFTSALLLFAMQPMFTRMVLPRLGGSPSVWSVAMVFFQTMLLAGYAYAHVLMRAVRPPIAIAVHLALLIAAGLTLPLSVARGWGDPPGTWAALWLIGLFAVSIGLPFFALAANNPLLQAWFVRTGHPAGKDPYFLYAASNAGSFLALISYPFVLEPTLSLRQHIGLWSGGFWLLFALIVACGYLLLRSPARADVAAYAEAPASPAPSWLTLTRWGFLAAVPSGLLVAVTAYISTDIAAAPLLWVVPLSLYLLTFVLVFQSRPLLPHRWMLHLQPFAIAGIVALLPFNDTDYLLFDLGAHLLAFFIIANGEPWRACAAAAAAAASDLIIVDAYSSDAIPIHLATREAMAIYKSKIAPDGVVALHLSNANLALDDVAVGIAAANGMKTWIYDDSAEEDDDDAFIYSSDVAVAVNNTEDAGELAASKNWKLTEPEPAQRPWTDDYSNIVRALIKKLDWPGWNMLVR